MGHSYVGAGGLGDFTVTKSNPGAGLVIRFTISDTGNKLTTSKMIQAVLKDAIQQWIDAERADLNAAGHSAMLGDEDYPGVGDGYKDWVWNYAGKYAEFTLLSKTSISVAGDLTVSIPYGDV